MTRTSEERDAGRYFWLFCGRNEEEPTQVQRKWAGLFPPDGLCCWAACIRLKGPGYPIQTKKAENCVGFVSFSFTGTAHAFHIGIPLEPSPATMDRSGSFGHPVQQVQPTSISNTTGARHAHRRFYGHPHVTRRPIGTRVLLLWTVYRGERGVVYSRFFSKASNEHQQRLRSRACTHARAASG